MVGGIFVGDVGWEILGGGGGTLLGRVGVVVAAIAVGLKHGVDVDCFLLVRGGALTAFEVDSADVASVVVHWLYLRNYRRLMLNNCAWMTDLLLFGTISLRIRIVGVVMIAATF